MPDSFFQSEKKRKRPERPGGGGPSGSRPPRSSGVGGGGGYEKPFRPAAYGKGQRLQGQAKHAAQRKSRSGAGRERDEELSSDAGGDDGVDLDDMDFRGDRGREDEREDEDVVDANETAAEKRVRLAKGYLRKVQDEMEASRDDQDYDAAEIDRELIAARLQKDVSEAEGRIHTFLAFRTITPRTKLIKLPMQVPTGIATTSTSIYVSTKRGLVYRYALPSLRQSGKPFDQDSGSAKKGKAPAEQVTGHKGEILCVAASEDGRYVVTGGRDKLVGVWEVEGDSIKWVAGMRGHKDAVTSIAFPPLSNPSHHILTASLSRHLTLHSLSTLSAIDTFFGHQDSISSVSSLKPTLAVTAGSRDRTCRWWKVEEEIQLVFRGGGRSFEGQGAKGEVKKGEVDPDDVGENGHVDTEKERPKRDNNRKGKGREFVEGSLDVVCMVDDQRFLSGGDSGSLCLWQTAKKKPIYTQPLAHGIEDLLHESEASMAGPRWITAIGALRGTDLFATGSWDGHIRLWALDASLRSFRLLQTLKVSGIVNAIQIISVPANSVDSAMWQSTENGGTTSNGHANGHSDNADADQEEAEAVLREEGSQENKEKEKREILLVAAVAQEPRLGRWLTLKQGAKNGVFVAHLLI